MLASLNKSIGGAGVTATAYARGAITIAAAGACATADMATITKTVQVGTYQAGASISGLHLFAWY